MKTLTKKMIFKTGLISVFFLFAFSGLQAQSDSPQLNDAEIASVAVTANQIDVDYAALAKKKSNNKDVIRFAQTMQDDHNSVIKMATDLARKLGVTPQDNDVTQSLLSQSRTQTDLLNSKSGKDFDKTYIDNEVAYHEAVINSVETVLIPQSENQELKDLLIRIMPTLKSHLEHAKKLQRELK